MDINMNTYTHVPPGFRFHPTDEELVDYYLRRKINSRRIDFNVIKEVDLYKIEPWDLQEICRMGNEEQSEWYFFSHKDRKYPTGSRTNRATTAGFWKATGRDKAIYSKHELIGMRKTLVFYKGRAPNGQKSDWIMHEYRLEDNANGTPQEEGWVVCKVVFKKRSTTMRNSSKQEPSSCWYNNQVSFRLNLDFPKQTSQSSNSCGLPQRHSCIEELNHHHHHHQQQQQQQPRLPNSLVSQDHLIRLPLLDDSKVVHPSNECLISYGLGINQHENAGMQQLLLHEDNDNEAMFFGEDQCALYGLGTDWRALDKFVASQFVQEDASKGTNNHYPSSSMVSDLLTAPLSDDHSTKEESMLDNVSTSTSGSQMEVWK